MILEQCASVSQGVILSRIETIPSCDTVNLPLYTMKEMNESIGADYSGSAEKLQEVNVQKDKYKDLPMSKDGMIVISLTGHRAVAIRPEHTGKVIPSNFAIIEPNDILDPDYLEWYVNEHPNCRRQLRIAIQGSSVSALSIQMLRSLEIELPPIADQRRTGKINQLIHQKKRLLVERMGLEETLIKHFLLNGIIKEDLN